MPRKSNLPKGPDGKPLPSPGRPKGTPNRGTKAIKDAIQASFDKVGGVDYLVKLAEEDKPTYCSLLKGIIPKESIIDIYANRPTYPDVKGKPMEELMALVERGLTSKLAAPTDN